MWLRWAGLRQPGPSSFISAIDEVVLGGSGNVNTFAQGFVEGEFV